MAGSLENLSSCYIEDKPIVMEELGRGAYAVVKKVRKFYHVQMCIVHTIIKISTPTMLAQEVC